MYGNQSGPRWPVNMGIISLSQSHPSRTTLPRLKGILNLQLFKFNFRNVDLLGNGYVPGEGEELVQVEPQISRHTEPL